eukprot:GHVU01042560.1.p2 GENE.GHVU01042560.1~~GHVU01042560.1.p2  ORF type:complete len:107 (-),score=13.76 GHVU01042560.1:36-356(-)
MYACVYVCMNICMCVCIYVCVCVCMYVYVCMCVRMQLLLLDVASRRVVAELLCPGGVRHCIWNQDQSRVACITKHAVVVANNKLEFLGSYQENLRVKSGVWDASGP